jgi:hypothetical protein
MDKPRPGTFSPFLEERARLEKRAAPAGTPVSPIRLLGILAAAGGAMTVSELMSGSEMPFSQFADALSSVKLAGFVDVGGEPETATLTAKGHEVAALAPPA